MLTAKNENCFDNTLKITNNKGADIQKGMYGLFFEDINYAADGGLYAELIENRSFEAQKCKNNGNKTFDITYDGLYSWSSDNGTMILMSEGGLNENNPHYMRFTGISFENGAYEGVYAEQGKKYKVSFWAKSDSFDGSVSVSVGSNRVKVTDSITNRWKKYTVALTADESTRHEKFVVELSKPGTVDFDMISMIPEDALFGALRPDLANMLRDLHPGFLRFPGGCVVEGNSIDNRYDWKKSVGMLEERKQNWNRWAVKSPKDRPDEGYSHYNQTLGLGYFEYFELCEYLECEPLPVVGVGIACQYDTNVAIEQYPMDSDEFRQCIQDALDLIDFANSTDFENNEWARLRRDMGHSKPFNLRMIGVGNEQWEASDSQFFARYEAFEKAIHEKMPQMKIIGTCGPDALDGGKANEWRMAWSWTREKAQTNPDFAYAMDEHYYRTPDWFLTKNDFYDNYDRSVKVFAGEYASRWVNDSSRADLNTLETALSVASFMTGLERNADVVYMASYAPLLARLGYMQWSPDMIWFDDAGCCGSPEYHVQAMYAQNLGDYTVESNIDGADCVVNEIYQTVSYDDDNKTMIIKLVNNSGKAKNIKLDIANEWKLDLSRAQATVLTARSIDAYNTIDNKENVAPITTAVDLSNGIYALAAQSVTVIRIPAPTAV